MEDAHAVLGHHVQLGVLDGDDVLTAARGITRALATPAR
jgi:hypothetical protein